MARELKAYALNPSLGIVTVAEREALGLRPQGS